MTRERNDSTVFADRVDFPYWDGLAHGLLRIQRCARCERWQWPADWRCPGCGSYDLEWPEVALEGVVYSWIRTHYPFVAAYAPQLPYLSVLVDLPHAGGARLIGHLQADTAPSIGDRVTGEIAMPTPQTLDLAVVRWSPVGRGAR